MSEYTEHYNLKKPSQSESYNVDDANTNNTIIDRVLYEKVDKKSGKDLSTNDFTDGYKKKIDSMQTLYRFKRNSGKSRRTDNYRKSKYWRCV